MVLTHYVVIRRDLTFGEYSAQLAHAGEAYALRRDHEAELRSIANARLADPFGGVAPYEVMGLNTTVAVVKGARTEHRLVRLEQALLAAKVPHVAIRGEQGENGGRLAGQLTCISLMPAERDQVEPFVREFHTINGLDGPDVVHVKTVDAAVLKERGEPNTRVSLVVDPSQDAAVNRLISEQFIREHQRLAVEFRLIPE